MADLFLIPYVREAWHNLRHRLGATGRMAIFGAGEHTHWLFRVTADLPSLPVVAVLDDRPRVEAIAGVPVRQATGFDPASVALVLVSSDQWEETLARRCGELWGGRVEVVRLYEGLPPGPYDKDPDREVVRRLAASARGRRKQPHNPDGLHVALVSGHPRSREAKLGAALRAAGCRVTLLHRYEPAFDPSASADEAIAWTHPWQALRLACSIGADIHHVMVSSDYRTAEVFVTERTVPVVVDSYDLIAGMWTDEFLAARPQLASQIELERACLEGADGVISRSGEVAYVWDELGYRIGRCATVADGCWNQVINAAVRPRAADGDIHVVYAGNFAPGATADDPFGDFGCWIPLAECLTRGGVDFHLYPSVAPGAFDSEPRLEPYRGLRDREPRFHLHAPVPADRLIAELARYDVGVFIYNELAGLSRGARVITPAKMRTCATNKFYDYVDAGLAIAHNALPGSGLANFARRQGVGIDLSGATPEDWPALLRRADFALLKAAACRARAALDIRRAGPRLLAFYRDILNDTDASSRAPRASDGEEYDYADAGQGNRPALL